MGTRASEIREDIARTRENLGETIDAVEDRVSPRRMAARGKERVRRKLHNAREKVMGVDVDSQQVEDQIKGNPLAAGMIAFGAGALVASLLPADRSSKEAAQALAEKAEPMVEDAKAELKEVGSDIGRSAGESAKESAHRLQEEAKTSAQHVKEDARSSAEQVKEETGRSSGQTGSDPYRTPGRTGTDPYGTSRETGSDPYPTAGEIRREQPGERGW
ncbi:DUF3618 domain-containing protein [Glycomyces albidus]|uniref:DUF3618 domain-containing protein n=1 Tax=Glycomyces albidus TaxID=2656774 RepID=A0A6L5GAQ2_9ACTN|nr:DUF3618 domain-containing protein [Glycomyces albidus]MQM26734.1 DUF3618 domain-containing protein [Glycomyces albidus]